MAKSRKTKQAKSEQCVYVLFGFAIEDESKTGYFGNDLSITDDIMKAKRFPRIDLARIKGFAEPEHWLELINEDKHLNKGYKFHLVKTCFK